MLQSLYLHTLTLIFVYILGIRVAVTLEASVVLTLIFVYILGYVFILRHVLSLRSVDCIRVYFHISYKCHVNTKN